MIGAPGYEAPGAQAAARLDVLGLLLSGRIGLVHYAGHGSFDPDNPRETGWVFADGLLTAREIAQVDRAPALIVANACLSGRLSRARAGGDARGRFGEAGLLPSLADEFFHRGVLNYVGTAWEVDDRGAIDFAKSFYRSFLDEKRNLGDTMLAARERLYGQRDRYGSLWAAYQHYGDVEFDQSDL